jgi:quinoprotein glucose dehydrogenase
MFVLIIGAIAAVLALAILYPGVQLAMAGGSVFYVVMGLGLLIAAIQLIRRKQSGFLIYAAVLIVTFGWTLYEVGFDKWQWIPRGALLTFLGLLLCLPFVPKGLKNPGRSVAVLRATVGVIAILGVVSWFFDPRLIEGDLPQQAAAETAPAVEGTAQFPADDWVAYGGNNLGQRYSSLSDINLDTVKNLNVAWEHHTGDTRLTEDPGELTFEATPLKVNGLLYLCTPHNIVEALVPETGEVKWKFNPELKPNVRYQHQTCRGVSYNDSSDRAAVVPSAPTVPATDGTQAPAVPVTSGTSVCPRRIIATTVDARLFAINADTGELCSDFGDNGFVDLLAQMPSLNEASYMQTSAPLVTNDLIIIGGSVSDNYYEDNTSGVIRAYDVRTGQIVWKFDAQKPNETAPLAPGQTYEANSPVAWTTFSADEALGLVYVPFGNKSPDQFGMGRTTEDAEFVDALVALDIETGQMRWKFQTSYHDLWDRDIPSQPTLLDLPKDGKNVPAIIIPTKVGNLWVLNREDGTPILPVNEMQVKTDTDVPKETPSPVQPMSSLSFTPAVLREVDMWGVSPIDQAMCRLAYKSNRYDGNPFTPPTLTGSLVWPGNIGVFNWGSIAVDPVNKWLIGTPQYLPYLYKAYPRPEGELDKRLFTKDGARPSNENLGGPFGISIQHFRSGLGLPCNAPPWGEMVGVDLTTGKTAWKRRNGTVQDQKILGYPWPVPMPMGILSHGGTLTTAGGVSFTAATLDNYLRAYDMKTGEKLWQARLPAGGQATPMTYRGADGKQYVVLSAGGHGSLGTTPGDSVIAYRLD